MGQDHSAFIEKAVTHDRQLLDADDNGCRKRRYSNDLDVFRRKKLKLEGRIIYSNYRNNKNDDMIRGCEWSEDSEEAGSPNATDSVCNKNHAEPDDDFMSDCRLKQLLVSRPQLGNILREQLTRPRSETEEPVSSLDPHRGRAYTAPSDRLSKIRTKIAELRNQREVPSRISPLPETQKTQTPTKVPDQTVVKDTKTETEASPAEDNTIPHVAASLCQNEETVHIKHAESPHSVCNENICERQASDLRHCNQDNQNRTNERPRSNSCGQNNLAELLDKALPDIIHNTDYPKTQEKFNLMYYLHMKNDNKTSRDCVCEGERSILQDLLEKRVKKEVESESEEEDDVERPDTPTWLSLYDEDADPAKIAEYANKVKKSHYRKQKTCDGPVQRRHTFSHCLPKSSSKGRRSGSFSGALQQRPLGTRTVQATSGGVMQVNATRSPVNQIQVNATRSPTNEIPVNATRSPVNKPATSSCASVSESWNSTPAPVPPFSQASGQCYNGFSEYRDQPRLLGPPPNLIKVEPVDVPSMPPLIDMGRPRRMSHQGMYQHYPSDKGPVTKDDAFTAQCLNSLTHTTSNVMNHFQRQRHELFRRQQEHNSYFYPNCGQSRLESHLRAPLTQGTLLNEQKQRGIVPQGLRTFGHPIPVTGSHSHLNFVPPISSNSAGYDMFAHQLIGSMVKQPEHYSKSSEPVDLSKYSLLGYAQC